MKSLALLMILVFLLSGCFSANNPTVFPSTIPTTLPTSMPTIIPITEPTTNPGTEPTTDSHTDPATPMPEPTTSGIELPIDPVTEPEPTTEPSTVPSTEPPTVPPHEHGYSTHVVKPTCTESGYTEYTCECGDTYIDDETEAHGHNYDFVITDPTCTADGYTTYTCTVCGDQYSDARTEATGHSYSNKVVDPTTEAGGYTEYTCTECGYSYKDNYTEKVPEPTEPPCEHEFTRTSVSGTCLEAGHYLYECVYCEHSYKEPNGQGWREHYYEVTEYKDATAEEDGYCLLTCQYCGNEMREPVYYETEPPYRAPDAKEVAQAVVKYINQFRAEQGDTQLEVLPGMTKVAEYRSVQLKSNYDHDVADIREAHAYYQYGEYIDMTTFGHPEGDNYYTSGAGEAIGRAGVGQVNADEAGKIIAEQFRVSAPHWSYVGSSKNSYIGVGCYFWGGEWFTCIMVGPTNYG